MTSDENLMLKFKAGSRESFDELFGRYQPAVFGFFRRRLHSQTTAEDLAQETWVVVLKGSVRYESRSLFRSYLYAIAFRLMLAERRRLANQIGHAAAVTYSNTQSADTDCWIREALDRLDSTDREVLMLREYEQLRYDEIAELLCIPINTVRSRLFRARLAAKQLLESGTEQVSKLGRF